MNEEEIRACGGELVAAVRPHVLVGIRAEDREVAERIFSATTTLLLQVLVDINRIATALENHSPTSVDIGCGSERASPIAEAMVERFGIRPAQP